MVVNSYEDAAVNLLLNHQTVCDNEIFWDEVTSNKENKHSHCCWNRHWPVLPAKYYDTFIIRYWRHFGHNFIVIDDAITLHQLRIVITQVFKILIHGVARCVLISQRKHLLKQFKRRYREMFEISQYAIGRRGRRGVMVKSMDFGIVVFEFEIQSCYYVHFQTNTHGKGMNPLILPAMG